MKTLLTSIILLLSLIVNAQQKDFLLEGQIVDQSGNAVPDVYVVNLRNHEKDISRDNGVFSIWVSSSDSLLLSHISYFRKVATVHSLLINPVVKLTSEDVNIPEVRISADELSDEERAAKNLEFLKDYDVPHFTKIDNDPNPVSEMMTENNRLLRTEASSVSIVRISPSEQIEKIVTKLKKKDSRTEYSSTRRVKHPPSKKKDD